MNKTEEIIKVAIEGNYSGVPHSNQKGRWTGIRVVKDDDIAWLFLDPKFWQAIGKARGWDKNKWIEMGTVEISVGEYGKVLKECEFHAIRFYSINLTQSFDDAINYLYELIK